MGGRIDLLAPKMLVSALIFVATPNIVRMRTMALCTVWFPTVRDARLGSAVACFLDVARGHRVSTYRTARFYNARTIATSVVIARTRFTGLEHTSRRVATRVFTSIHIRVGTVITKAIALLAFLDDTVPAHRFAALRQTPVCEIRGAIFGHRTRAPFRFEFVASFCSHD